VSIKKKNQIITTIKQKKNLSQHSLSEL
jgi:hypothetical protein